MRRDSQARWTGLMIVLGMACGSLAARAEEASPTGCGCYVSVSGGWQERRKTVELDATQFTSWHSDYVANLAIGYRFNPSFRADLEYTSLENDAKRNKAGIPGAVEADADGTVKFAAVTVNGYFDLPIKGTRLSAFAGGGVGFWRAELSGLTSPELARLGNEIWGKPLVLSDDSSVTFGWQVRGGLGYGLTDRVGLFAEYRYFHGCPYDLSFPDYDISIEVPAPEFHMFQIGVTYRM